MMRPNLGRVWIYDVSVFRIHPNLGCITDFSKVFLEVTLHE